MLLDSGQLSSSGSLAFTVAARPNAGAAVSQEQLDLALRAAAMGVWDCEIATGRVAWAGESAALFGVAVEEFSGTLEDIQRLIHPEDRARNAAVYAKTVQEGAEFDDVYRILLADGSVRWLHSLGRLICDQQGRPERVVGVTWDITERRRSEQQMAALSAVVKHSDAIIVVKDLDLRVIATNKAFAQAAGYDSEAELIGKTDAEIFRVSPESEPIRSYMEDERAAQRLAAGEAILRDELVVTHDGRKLCYLTKKYPIYDQEERLIGTGNISVNITDRRLAEQRLIEANAALENANAEARALAARAESASRAKGAFLANMSHEIRTPLNAVLGLARIGMRDSRSPESRETFDEILQAGEHLLGVINDILDYAKIEAGRFALDRHAFQLSHAIRDASGLLSAAAEQKGLRFLVHQAPDLPEWVMGDDQRLRQILVNLLSNAVKFTDRGAVSLSVFRRDERLCFAVEDTGIGLSEADAARLFQAFEQLDASPARRHGGTGLGLVISRHLAQIMGGEIQVQSALGKGSTFLLDLCLPPTEPAATETHEPEAKAVLRLAGLRILAAEDVPINRLILEDLIVHEGAQISIAENGREIVDRVRESGANAFDLILMDIQMPELDGYAATEQILAMDPRIPVIGLTAHAMAEERARCEAAGMVDHVAKPFEPDQLVASILRHARSPGHPPGAALPGFSKTSGAVPESTDAGAGLALIPGLDLAQALEIVRGQPQTLRRLLVLFADHYRDVGAQMRQVWEEGELASAKRLAHSLKGAAGNLRLTQIQSSAESLEAMFADANDWGRVDLSLEILEEQLESCVAAIGRELGADTAP